MTRGQKSIRRLLQRLGVVPEGSKMSSFEIIASGACKSQPKPAGAPEEFFLSVRDRVEATEDEVKRRSRRESRRDRSHCGEGGLAALQRSLGEAQANDSGWPIFKGRYVE
jgi:hypothetical protein